MSGMQAVKQYKGYLTHKGFFVPVAALKERLGFPGYAALLRKLTITTMQKIGPPKITKMYLEFNLPVPAKVGSGASITCVYLPRGYIKLLSTATLTAVVNMFKPIVLCDVALKMKLYENQRILCDHLMKAVFTPERIRIGLATCILNLRAGLGKTFVAAGIIAALKMRTLYVVPTRPLALQAVKDLEVCMDGVIEVYGKTSSKKHKDDPKYNIARHNVTVIVINSAIMQTEEFFSKYSLVVLDEVHMYCTEHRRSIFRMSTHCVLGMSATTEDRNDGCDIVAHRELAIDGIIRAEEVDGFTYEDVDFDGTARIITYNGPPEYTQNLTHESTDNMFVHYMYNQFIEDPYRMKVVTDELVRLYDWRGPADQQHYIYVFAEEVEILRKAKTAFNKVLCDRQDILGDIDAPELGLELFTGGMKDEKINEIVLKGRVLFATFGFAGTGTSIPKMSAILYLTPRKSNMKQCVARILRRGSDITIPRIVSDIVDNKTGLRYQVGKRRLAYDFYGFETEYKKINYTDVPIRIEPLPV